MSSADASHLPPSAAAVEKAARLIAAEEAEAWYAKLTSSAFKANRLFHHALALTAENGASAEEAAATAASVRSSPFHDEKEEEERVEAACDAQMHRTELIQAILRNYEKKASKMQVAALHWIMCSLRVNPQLLDTDENGLKGAFGRYAYLAVAALRFLRECAAETAPPDLAKMRLALTALAERRQRLLRHLLDLARTGHDLSVLTGVTKSYEAAAEAEVACAVHWVWHWLAQNMPTAPAKLKHASSAGSEEELGFYAPLATAFIHVLA
jgi:hypothetical protein